MAQEIDLLKYVGDTLNRINIPYMLTGSFAANFYTVPRMTRDIDIVAEILQPDVARLFQSLQKNFYIVKSSIEEAILYESMFNAIHFDSGIKIDFIVNKTSPFSIAEFQRRHVVNVDGVGVWIISCEDLIISKLDWAKDSFSEQQILDIRKLLASTQTLDIQYIHQWIKRLKLETIYKKVQSERYAPGNR